MIIDKTFGTMQNGKDYYDRYGAYLIEIKDKKVATVKTDKGYFLLGGGIEENENHIQCIERECIEEIGCSVKVKSYLCSAEEYSIHQRIGYFHPVQFYYVGTINEKVTTPMEKDHIFQWINIDDIDKLMYSQMQVWAIKMAMNK